jgi:hypothetical protein
MADYHCPIEERIEYSEGEILNSENTPSLLAFLGAKNFIRGSASKLARL